MRQNSHDRITFSLPNHLNVALDELKSETKQSKSEIIKIAIDQYIADQKRKKMQKAVALMADEYAHDGDLTALSVLDSEEFR